MHSFILGVVLVRGWVVVPFALSLNVGCDRLPLVLVDQLFLFVDKVASYFVMSCRHPFLGLDCFIQVGGFCTFNDIFHLGLI